MASQIPSELLDTIIDYLRDEVSALCACGLVSRRWLPRSRYHLFAFVHLTSTNIVSALEILGPASTFLPSVRALMLTEGRGFWDRKWLDTSLPEVPLSRMVGVQSLTLSNVRWYALGEAAKTSISALAQGVKSLCFINFRMQTFAQLLELLSESPALVALKMNRIAFGKPEDTSPVETYTIPRSLGTLELGDGTKCLLIDWLLGQHRIPNIHTVVLTMVTAREAPSVSGLLYRLGPCLEHLDISLHSLVPGDTEAVFCQHVDMTPNVSLRSITFLNLFLYGDDAAPNAGWIRSILSQITSQQLQQVTFSIVLNAPEELTLLELPQVAALFRENQRFSRLTTVLFMIHGDLQDGLREEVHLRIKASLSDLDARGRLQLM